MKIFGATVLVCTPNGDVRENGGGGSGGGGEGGGGGSGGVLGGGDYLPFLSSSQHAVRNYKKQNCFVFGWYLSRLFRRAFRSTTGRAEGARFLLGA